MSDDFIERRIITGLITSTDYLRELQHIYKPNLLQSQAAEKIAGWCFRHFKKHNVAPGPDIQIVYNSYLRRGKLDKEQAEDIESVLESLSDDHTQQINIEVLTTETLAYFDERAVIALADDIRNDALRGDTGQAHAKIAQHKPSQRASRGDCDFFADDAERTRKVFENVPEPIIQYPGKLGMLLNRHLVRGGLLGLLGQEKVGKTWTLMDFGFQAQRCGLNVAFFAAGDMNRDEMELRKYIYLGKKSNEKEYCKSILVPTTDCWLNQSGICDRAPGLAPFQGLDRPAKWEKDNYYEAFEQYEDHEVCTKCIGKAGFAGAPWFKERAKVEPLTWKEGYKLEKKHRKRMRGSQWKFVDYPGRTLTCSMLDNQLRIWHSEGFNPGVVLVDYPDIMADDEEDKRMEYRLRENMKWIKLRAMAHRWNCLFIVATQAASTAYNKYWLDLNDYSESKGKYSHATAFFGLNQTDDEAELGLFRWNQLLVRSGKKGKFYATVLQRLEMGRPFLGSF